MTKVHGEVSTGEYPGHIGPTDDTTLRQAEIEAIRKSHGDAREDRLYGLAFSGGGIRSAAFALGVSQALARLGWLERFHYLSTVSGGGYLGASLSWLWHHWPYRGAHIEPGPGFDAGAHFPYRAYHNDDQSEAAYQHPRALLRHLRQHGRYLTPGGGIDGFSLLAVILRGTILSLLVFGAPAVLLLTGYRACLETASWALTTILLLGAAGFVLLTIAYGLATGFKCMHRPRAYRWRRCFEHWTGWLLRAISYIAVLASLPWVAGTAHDYLGTLSSSLAAGGGAGALALIRRLRLHPTEHGRIRLLAPLAMGLLGYGLLLLGYDLAGRIVELGTPGIIGLTAASALGIVLGLVADANRVSVHRYYRDRLMELFLPDAQAVIEADHDHKGGPAAAARHGKDLPLSALLPGQGAIPTPFPILNANMVTTNSSRAKLRARGGDNFILSPLYCGSDATGWCRTNRYMNDRMNLATAMAISGAAADPHGAPDGEGLTRHRSLSLLMALLNLRLGYWAPNPARTEHGRRIPRWLRLGLCELTGRGMHEGAGLVHLADGGHFENLGVYELIRRRARVIVCCDAAADPGYTFTDFANLAEKVRADFGVDIEMPSFLPLCPRPDRDATGNLRNPHGVDLAERGFLHGTIRYDDGTRGHLIYIKTTLVPGLPKDIYGYHSAHPEFPDETTADQFFDERQFEAYRELGYRIALDLAGDEAIALLFPWTEHAKQPAQHMDIGT